MAKKIRVGIIGSQFISQIHADSLARCAAAEMIAVASPTPGNAAALAEAHGIPHHFTDYRRMLEIDELDMIVVGV
ncbi:MAG: Gfo/Idh/MocA family oxidoreductase, partial [Planctomycetales bacterium]|nr:Gfo/Idh/MocA family oxidoreductase [Planctomycetales bacterium]